MSFSVAGEVRNVFAAAMRASFPLLSDISPLITASNPKFGDYQCNSTMTLFKKYNEELGHPKSPKEIAERLHDNLDSNLFSELSISKQGFITVRLSSEFLKSKLCKYFTEGIAMTTKDTKSLRCLVDYSSPNIAKEMHVGHLRSTILGESICRLLEFAGHTVKRINHLGDWGTQFGMLIEYMKEKYPNFQENPPTVSDLTTIYREAKFRFDTDDTFKSRSQLAVPQLQQGNAFARAAWALFCDISRKDFQRLYDRLGVSLIERGESFYNDMIPEVVQEIEERGFITKTDGAQCMFIANDAVPLMLVKSDGGFGYDSTDVAAIKHRLLIDQSDWVIVVTDIGQESHFKKIYAAAEMMGWHRPNMTRCSHVGFGLVQGEDGKKFKTRSGDVTKLTDLLDEAVQRALKEIKLRKEVASLDNNNNADIKEFDDSNEEEFMSPEVAAEKIGLAAIRYFDLKQNRVTNYRFSYDKMLDPKGNTAVYLLYAYARICAILRKAKKIEPANLNPQNLELSEPQERELALQLLKLFDVIDICLEDLHIHRIAEYLYELSGIFTSFYQHCKVIGSEKQESRLLLCELTRQFFEKAFYILGIEPLPRI